jgi:hypothetical protein
VLGGHGGCDELVPSRAAPGAGGGKRGLELSPAHRLDGRAARRPAEDGIQAEAAQEGTEDQSGDQDSFKGRHGSKTIAL